MYACVRACACVLVCVHACVCVYIYVCNLGLASLASCDLNCLYSCSHCYCGFRLRCLNVDVVYVWILCSAPSYTLEVPTFEIVYYYSCDETHSSHECNRHFFWAGVLNVEKYKKANSLVGCQLLDWGRVKTESRDGSLTWLELTELRSLTIDSYLDICQKTTDWNVRTEMSLRVRCR